MRMASTALLLICVAMAAIYLVIRFSEPPDVSRPHCEGKNIVQVENGFSVAERSQFYHDSFGSEMFPKDWLLALENPRTGRPLLNDLDRYGLVCDPGDPHNLPIGFSVAPSRVLPSGRLMVGMNCSICHVAELRYRGKQVRIDGAPSQFDVTRFATEFGEAMEATLKSPRQLYRFLRRLHALREEGGRTVRPRGKTDFADLRRRYRETLRQLKARKQYFDQLARLKKELGGTPSGPGRADTWVTARNSVFAAHATPWNSPCSYPHLWGYGDSKWLTWNGTTTSGADRDIATALGMMTFFDLQSYKSSVSPQALFDVDESIGKLQSPKWPAEVFGPVDEEKYARGEALYRTHCARCHDSRTMIEVAEVGTDPQHMHNYQLPVGGRPFHEVFPEEMRKFKDVAYRDNNVPQTAIDRFEQKRPNQWRATSSYVARPLNGIWATAPYLHNGSVPTLLDLLAPAGKRPRSFTIGSVQYDPEKLGFVSDTTDDRLFHFDTTLVGNSNQGHEYGTDLELPERYDLLEYLKGL